MLFTNYEIREIIIILAALVVGLVFHEFAHALVARLLGDKSKINESRLTLNPLKHIDPMGFVFIILLGFGWAKPVRVNPKNFKRPILDEILISLAGPFANFLIAIGFMGFYRVLLEVWPDMSAGSFEAIRDFTQLFVLYNLMLGIFNLMPIPPLDGSHLYTGLLYKYKPKWYIKVQQYGFYVLIGILLLNNFVGISLLPISYLMQEGYTFLFNLFFSNFG